MLQQSVRSDNFVSDEEGRAGNVLAHREDARTFEPVLVFLADVGLPIGLVGFGDRQHAQSQQTDGKAVARQELFVCQSFDDGLLMKRHCLVSQRIGLTPGVPSRIVRLPPAVEQALVGRVPFRDRVRIARPNLLNERGPCCGIDARQTSIFIGRGVKSNQFKVQGWQVDREWSKFASAAIAV